MDATLSDEQQMFVDMFRDFAQQEVAPLAEEIDRAERAPLESLSKAAALDLLGIALPDEYGGMNAGMLSYGLLLEELGKACLSTALSLGAHCTAAMALASAGNEAQKQRFLPALIKGEPIAALATAEPDAGSDFSMIATTARRQDGVERIFGRKIHVINGDVAGVFLVLGRVEENFAAFIVEKGTPGFTVGWRDRQMGLRGAAGCSLFFDDCRVPAANRLGGDEPLSPAAFQRTWQFSRLGTSFAALGIAERGLADSLEFARNRQQFGAPIGQKQAVQAHLGEMGAQIESLRRLAYHTARLMDEGKAAEIDLAMLKLMAGQVATYAINKTLQIHGGMGYIKSFHVERLYRDVRALAILDGPNETQRLTVASELLAVAGMPVRM